MNRAKTGTLPKLRPAAPSGRENWGATVVILGGNGYNKSYKEAEQFAEEDKKKKEAVEAKNQAETMFQLQKGVY